MAALGEESRGTLNPQYDGTTNRPYIGTITNAPNNNSLDRSSSVVMQVANPMYAISLPNASVSGAGYVGGPSNTVPHTARSLKSKGFVRGGTARASTYSAPVIQLNNTVEVTADDGPVYAIPMDVEYLQVGASNGATSATPC